MLMLQGTSDCLSGPKKSSIVCVCVCMCVCDTYHFNANFDLYMKARVKGGAG